MNGSPPEVKPPLQKLSYLPFLDRRDRRQELARLLGGVVFDPEAGVSWQSLNEEFDAPQHVVIS